MTLAEYIAQLNAPTLAEQERNPDGFYLLLTDDLEHWSSMGVTTPSELEHFLARSDYSDTHKEVNGFRPRRDLSHLTAAEIRKMTRCLRDPLDELGEEEPEEALDDGSPLTHQPFAALAGLSF